MQAEAVDRLHQEISDIKKGLLTDGQRSYSISVAPGNIADSVDQLRGDLECMRLQMLAVR